MEIQGLESDEEIRRVPEIGGESAGTSASRPDTGSVAGPERTQGTGDGSRKRGRSSADKESKRLKRYVSCDQHLVKFTYVFPFVPDP